jgi:hypothetical protein
VKKDCLASQPTAVPFKAISKIIKKNALIVIAPLGGGRLFIWPVEVPATDNLLGHVPITNNLLAYGRKIFYSPPSSRE